MSESPFSFAFWRRRKPRDHSPTFPVCTRCGESWPCEHERNRERREWNFENPYGLRHDLGCGGNWWSQATGPAPLSECTCPARGEQEQALAVEAVGRFLRGGGDFFHAHVAWRKRREEANRA